MTILFRQNILYLEIFLNTFERSDAMAFADTFKALSDPARREILQLLKNGRMSAGEIGSHFHMTGATVSYHLKILKKADLIWETKEKNFIYYGIIYVLDHSPRLAYEYVTFERYLSLLKEKNIDIDANEAEKLYQQRVFPKNEQV